MSHETYLAGLKPDIADLKPAAKRACLVALPLVGLVALGAVVLGLSITFADNAAATRGGDYREFAKISNSEKTLKAVDCRNFGGRPVTNGEYDVVMRTGRSDEQLYNVLHYGGYPYVTFKVDTSNALTRLLGIEDHKIGLCQF